MEIRIELAEPEYDWEEFQNASDIDRPGSIVRRQELLRASQEIIVSRTVAVGGKVKSRMWLSNALDVEIPASRVEEVSRWPGVVGVAISEAAEPLGSWDGTYLRRGLMLDGAPLQDDKADFYRGCFYRGGPFDPVIPPDPLSCHDGNTGSRLDATKPTRIAIVEQDASAYLLFRNHVGWKDWAGGPSRILSVKWCSTSGCTTMSATGTADPHAGTGGGNHGTRVTWVAAGSIEQGQDPNLPLSTITSPPSRDTSHTARSGVAKESKILYYSASGTTSLGKAIEAAVADGADVINLSWGNAFCNTVETYLHDSGGLNTILRNALLAGALPIASTGNTGNDGSTCKIRHPAWRPHVLSVGALGSSSQTTSNVNSLGAWYENGTWGTARGGAKLRIGGGPTDRVFSGVDLVAPGCLTSFFNNDSNGYYSGADLHCGTSLASPAVAGTAALVRDAFNSLGWTGINSARWLMVNLLVMGDGWESVSGQKPRQGVGLISGAGRLKAHWPGGANLSAPFGWGTGYKTIKQGEVLSWPVGSTDPESSLVTGWKGVITWFDSDLAQSSDLLMRVVDTCGGLTDVWDSSYDFRKRLRLTQSDISNRCLEVQVHAYRTPTNGVQFWFADYFHGGLAEEQH